jgi:hypothetical protein
MPIQQHGVGQASHPCHLYAHSLNIPEQRKWLSRETGGLGPIQNWSNHKLKIWEQWQ